MSTRDKCVLIITTIFALGQAEGNAELTLAKDCQVHFATVAEARVHLAKRDVYIEGLSPFERAAKTKQAGPVSTGQFIEFIQGQALEWDAADKAKLREVIAAAKPKLAKFAKHLPKRITLIKTTGKDEGAAPYTRGTSIILPNRRAGQSAKGLERLFYHELFHIISRRNIRLRDELYKVIGYKKCGVVSLPGEMMPRRISNPDAPVVEHCIRVSKDGVSHWVAPVLFSRTPKYEPKTGGTFFRYLEFRLMVIDRKSAKATLKDGKPLLLKPDAVEGFYEQIGRNTDYIIHPEETLANNFVHLMTGRHGLKKPEIPEQIEKLLLAE
jgi:hypothetical protein